MNIFRSSWHTATFRTDQGKEENDELIEEYIITVLDEFGQQFIELT